MSEKPWDRPWSMEEIIENSDKWSLAGDVALLNTLKSLGDSLLSRTTEINNNLHNLTKQLDETSLQLNIAQNEFQSLRNSQFIESRVYEDDETLPQPDAEMPEDKVEPDRVEDIRSAALKGLEVLDQYFDKVEVSVSDSEDEDIDLPNYILRPKDLYIDRPLPYPIGSEEWHKSWHVGLEDSSSDSETEKVSDKFSESDSESDLPIIQDRSQIKGTSDTSSELDFPQKIDTSKTIVSSKELFHSSDSEDQNSMPVQAPISNKIFAEELAAKLGNVIKQDSEEPEVNRRPIQRKPQYGDLFFDEPPPLDEPKGLFSGGSGLFDDDDDVQFSTTVESKLEESPKRPKETDPVLFEGENSDEDIFNTKKQVLPNNNKSPLFSEEPPLLDEKKKPVGGVSIFGGSNLFDKKFLKRQPSSDEESENVKKVDEHDSVTSKKVDLFNDDDDDALFKSLTKEEKLVTVNNDNSVSKKINLFDSDDEDTNFKNYLFNESQKTLQQPLKNDKKSSAEALFKDNEKLTERENESKKVKTISLFDEDDDDLFKGDLFSSTTNSKFSSGLFDDDNFQNDLFSNKNSNKPEPVTNLFKDLINTTDNKKSLNINTQTEDKKKLLVDDPMEDIASVDDGNKESNVLADDSLFRTVENDQAVEIKPEAPKPKPRLSLFDSPPLDTDDLFSDETREEKTVPTKPTTTTSSNIFDAPANKNVTENDTVDKIKSAPVKTTSLFDSPFDDEQDDLFRDSEQTPKHSEKNSLFTSSVIESSENIFTEENVKIVPDMRLFDPVPPPDDDWESKSENLPSDENDSFAEQEDITTLKSSSSLFISEEPPSLDFSPKKTGTGKVSNITEKFEKEPQEGVKPNLNSPGKLKHNLNINVSALMPGSLPPKRGDIPKNPSPAKSEDGQTSFDTTDSVKVLHSITKDRVKVPLNRRPSTRRGRKAALKSTTSDFKLDQETDMPQDVTEETVSPESDIVTQPPKSDDLLFETEPPKSIIQETEPTRSDDLFEVEPILSSPKTSFTEPSPARSGDLFDVQVPSKQPKTDLFGDDEDDDGMFSSKKVPATQPTKVVKKSLFDDDTDDDDDIFKSSSSETRSKSSQIKSATEKKIAKVSTVKKLENTKLDDVDDDPLSALLK